MVVDDDDGDDDDNDYDDDDDFYDSDHEDNSCYWLNINFFVSLQRPFI